jgi:putative Ca2+/H+ antiporter (TMEM165/GDT1 family)
MIEDILIPLVAVGLAELGDKTQLAIFLLSTKTNKYLPLLMGVIIAFLIVDGVAILIGGWVANIVSYNLLKIISGILFILLGLLMI